MTGSTSDLSEPVTIEPSGASTLQDLVKDGLRLPRQANDQAIQQRPDHPRGRSLARSTWSRVQESVMHGVFSLPGRATCCASIRCPQFAGPRTSSTRRRSNAPADVEIAPRRDPRMARLLQHQEVLQKVCPESIATTTKREHSPESASSTARTITSPGFEVLRG